MPCWKKKYRAIKLLEKTNVSNVSIKLFIYFIDWIQKFTPTTFCVFFSILDHSHNTCGRWCAYRIPATSHSNMQDGRHEHQSYVQQHVLGRNSCAWLSDTPMYAVRRWIQFRWAQSEFIGETESQWLLWHSGPQREWWCKQLIQLTLFTFSVRCMRFSNWHF